MAYSRYSTGAGFITFTGHDSKAAVDILAAPFSSSSRPTDDDTSRATSCDDPPMPTLLATISTLSELLDALISFSQRRFRRHATITVISPSRFRSSRIASAGKYMTI
jgi:hypothetical protein